MSNLKGILIGFGNVGRALIKELVSTEHSLDIIGVFSSKGGVFVREDEDLKTLLKLATLDIKLKNHVSFKENFTYQELLEKQEIDVAFVSIPPSYRTGEPNLKIYRSLSKNNVNVITADKTGLAINYNDLLEEYKRKDLFFGYRATVAAGIPAIDLMRGLRGRQVEKIVAVLNATTNYILTLVEKGMSFEEAIKKSIKEKYAEPDPTVDTHGWDPAAKISILSGELGTHIPLEKVERIPLDSVSEESIRSSFKEGKRVKYVATFDVVGKKAFVRPHVLDAEDVLAKTVSTHNTIKVLLEDSEIILSGPVGPAWRTAKVMVTDFIEYKAKTNKDT